MMRSIIVFLMLWLSIVFLIQGNEFEWKSENVAIPILGNDTFSLDLTKLAEVFQKLEDRRVIWVFGKFKVGKSFLVDYIMGDTNRHSDSLTNTIGVQIWYDESYVVIDTEGMLQPVGTNDVFFVKSFLASFITKTADSMVYVTDQMDVIDLEFYTYFRSIYWGGAGDSMFHIHNCKSLDDNQLEAYKDRIKSLLKLSKFSADEEFRSKPVAHLFVPKISTGSIFDWFKSKFVKRNQINFLGNPLQRRKKLSLVSYVEAINEGLTAIGLPALKTFQNDENAIGKKAFKELDMPILPVNKMWCSTNKVYEMALIIDTNSILSVMKGTESSVYVKFKQLSKKFVDVDVDIHVQPPVSFVDPRIQPWMTCYNYAGYSSVVMKYVEGANGAMLRNCEVDLGDCSALVGNDRVSFDPDEILGAIEIIYDFVKPLFTTPDL